MNKVSAQTVGVFQKSGVRSTALFVVCHWLQNLLVASLQVWVWSAARTSPSVPLSLRKLNTGANIWQRVTGMCNVAVEHSNALRSWLSVQFAVLTQSQLKLLSKEINEGSNPGLYTWSAA